MNLLLTCLTTLVQMTLATCDYDGLDISYTQANFPYFIGGVDYECIVNGLAKEWEASNEAFFGICLNIDVYYAFASILQNGPSPSLGKQRIFTDFKNGVKCDSDDASSSFGYCLALKHNKQEVWKVNKEDFTVEIGKRLSNQN